MYYFRFFGVGTEPIGGATLFFMKALLRLSRSSSLSSSSTEFTAAREDFSFSLAAFLFPASKLDNSFLAIGSFDFPGLI